MTPAARRVAVIGGGISGLSAAWLLQASGCDVIVLEASGRWGGKVQTERVASGNAQPFIVEGGPDSFLTQKPWALRLARALGLDDQLIGTNDDRRQTFVLMRGRLTPLPDGLQLIVPTRLLPFALSPLISPLGKLRMACEPFMPARRDDEDESLAAFILRRLGTEVLDKLAEPLMSGIYSTDPHEQSVLATFPRYRQMEREYGSLTRAILATRGKPAPSAAGATGATGKPQPMFMSFRGGMATLIERLVERLDADLRLNAPVAAVEQLGRGWRLRLDDGTTVEADAMIVTTPAPAAAALVAPHAAAAGAILGAIRYVSTGTITLAYRAADLPPLPPSFGVVIPRSERRPINAVTVSSNKFDHRAPADHVLMRVFFGGSRSPQTVALDDAALSQVAAGELRAIYGIDAAPVLTRIVRWGEATPQYAVGHLERVAQMEAALPAGLYVTSGALRGVGVPDCVYQAEETVKRVLADANAGRI